MNLSAKVDTELRGTVIMRHRTTQCECGGSANRTISAPSINLEGWSGHFPSSWMKFDKKHRDKLVQEQKTAT
jgi:hypothetical protein